MTQTENTTSAKILATFGSNTLSEISQIAEQFLRGGQGRHVSMDGDRQALIGYFGPHESVQWDSDGPSGAVREVDG